MIIMFLTHLYSTNHVQDVEMDTIENVGSQY